LNYPQLKHFLLSAVGKQQKGRINMKQEQLRNKLEKQFKKYPDCVFAEEVSQMLRLGINTVYNMLRGNLISCYIVAGKYHVAKHDVIEFILASGYTEGISPTNQRKEIQRYCTKQSRTATEIARMLSMSTQYCRKVLLMPMCREKLLSSYVSSGNDRYKGVVLYQYKKPKQSKAVFVKEDVSKFSK
jgi:hypothetical protein